jgi:hypothetical protein
MSKRASPNSVIDLTLHDTQDDDDQYQSKRLHDIRRNLESSSGRDRNNKKVKTEGAVKEEGARAAVDYEDVQVVHAAAPVMVANPESTATTTTTTNDDDDDVVIVGTLNEVNLPHMRPHCTRFKFKLVPTYQSHLRNNNSEHCDLCFCFVCDCPVKDCKVRST